VPVPVPAPGRWPRSLRRRVGRGLRAVVSSGCGRRGQAAWRSRSHRSYAGAFARHVLAGAERHPI